MDEAENKVPRYPMCIDVGTAPHGFFKCNKILGFRNRNQISKFALQEPLRDVAWKPWDGNYDVLAYSSQLTFCNSRF